MEHAHFRPSLTMLIYFTNININRSSYFTLLPLPTTILSPLHLHFSVPCLVVPTCTSFTSFLSPNLPAFLPLPSNSLLRNYPLLDHILFLCTLTTSPSPTGLPQFNQSACSPYIHPPFAFVAYPPTPVMEAAESSETSIHLHPNYTASHPRRWQYQDMLL